MMPRSENIKYRFETEILDDDAKEFYEMDYIHLIEFYDEAYTLLGNHLNVCYNSMTCLKRRLSKALSSKREMEHDETTLCFMEGGEIMLHLKDPTDYDIRTKTLEIIISREGYISILQDFINYIEEKEIQNQ